YCFGQMQDENAVNTLITVLQDQNQEPMVRHEAAEALGAIGSVKGVYYLHKYKNDPVIEVAETCELALDRIQWVRNSKETEDSLPKNPYHSVDPAPPAASKNISELKVTLIDENASLFNRYRAMFALRNIGSPEALAALGVALKCGSALFKHEVAFVFGQMKHKDSVQYLIESLEDTSENEMVRHECA
nr:nero [Cucujiformia]